MALDLDNIVMIPGGSLAGRLVDEDGKGIGGALVGVGGANGKAITSEDGSYSIDGLPPGVYRMLVYFAREDHITLERKDIRVAPRQTTTVDIISLEGTTVAGRVINQDTGEPVEGAELHAYSEGFFGGGAATDKDGRYKLSVLPGPLRIQYSGGNPFYLPIDGIPKPVTVPKSGLKGWDIKLKRAELGHGTVVDENGEPLAGAVVSIGHFGRGASAVTDEKGSFSISLPPESIGGG